MSHPENARLVETRREVIRYVMRLIDYGKGEPVPEFEDASLGDIADRIIACVLPPDTGDKK